MEVQLIALIDLHVENELILIVKLDYALNKICL
jgi:hypothetical protein